MVKMSVLFSTALSGLFCASATAVLASDTTSMFRSPYISCAENAIYSEVSRRTELTLEEAKLAVKLSTDISKFYLAAMEFADNVFNESMDTGKISQESLTAIETFSEGGLTDYVSDLKRCNNNYLPISADALVNNTTIFTGDALSILTYFAKVPNDEILARAYELGLSCWQFDNALKRKVVSTVDDIDMNSKYIVFCEHSNTSYLHFNPKEMQIQVGCDIIDLCGLSIEAASAAIGPDLSWRNDDNGFGLRRIAIVDQIVSILLVTMRPLQKDTDTNPMIILTAP